MRTTVPTRTAAAIGLLAALAFSGCGGASASSDDAAATPDTYEAPDAAADAQLTDARLTDEGADVEPREDSAPEAGPDVVADTPDGDAPAGDLGQQEVVVLPGAVVKGHVVDSNGDPVPHPFLVLCGFVEEKEVCNQADGDASGYFEYTGLKTGYTHIEVLTFAAEQETGLHFAGINLPSVVASESDLVDLGDIIIPIVDGGATVLVSSGGTVSGGGLDLELAPDALFLPDASEQGLVAVQPVPLEQVSYSLPGMVAAYTLYPFSSMVLDGAGITLHTDQVEGLPPADMITLYHSPMAKGGLEALPSTLDGTDVKAVIPDLTWVVVAAKQ